jgi:hypothetical protein
VPRAHARAMIHVASRKWMYKSRLHCENVG